jgi:hypothetical protein
MESLLPARSEMAAALRFDALVTAALPLTLLPPARDGLALIQSSLSLSLICGRYGGLNTIPQI